MALDLDPSHLPTLGALRQIATDNADYDKAARYIDQEQSYTPAPRQRARLLVELGRLREDMLGDHDSAVLAWEAAHEADPENEEAAMPLVDEYIQREDWEKGEPLLDMLTRTRPEHILSVVEHGSPQQIAAKYKGYVDAGMRVAKLLDYSGMAGLKFAASSAQKVRAAEDELMRLTGGAA